MASVADDGRWVGGVVDDGGFLAADVAGVDAVWAEGDVADAGGGGVRLKDKRRGALVKDFPVANVLADEADVEIVGFVGVVDDKGGFFQGQPDGGLGVFDDLCAGGALPLWRAGPLPLPELCVDRAFELAFSDDADVGQPRDVRFGLWGEVFREVPMIDLDPAHDWPLAVGADGPREGDREGSP